MKYFLGTMLGKCVENMVADLTHQCGGIKNVKISYKTKFCALMITSPIWFPVVLILQFIEDLWIIIKRKD